MARRSGAGRQVQVFTDYVCPFSYLTWHGLERAKDELGLAIAWHAYELRPAPAPAAAPPSSEEWAVVAEVAREAGIRLQMPASAPRTRKAHEATKYAVSIGQADELRRAIFTAYFCEGRDIGRIDVLVDLAAALGMDRTAMKVALDVDAHADEVVADTRLAQLLEIEGTPALVAGEAVRIGYMSESHLRDWLKD